MRLLPCLALNLLLTVAMVWHVCRQLRFSGALRCETSAPGYEILMPCSYEQRRLKGG